MALSADEEETIEAVKRWWHETGRLLAAGIAIILVGWFGWQQWGAMQDRSAASASALFDDLTALVVVAPSEAVSGPDRQQAMAIVEQLKSDYQGSSYSMYAALFAARLAVEADELAQAESELQWVLDNQRSGLFSSTEETLLSTTNLRLGRVILAQGEPDRALSVISGVDPGALAAEFADLRGDIYMAQGQRSEALEAYRAAAAAGLESPVLQMKINDLASLEG